MGRRLLSSSEFRPRRRPNPKYRPVLPQGITAREKGPSNPDQPDQIEAIEIGNYQEGSTELERDFGPHVADIVRDNLRQIRNGGNYRHSADEMMKIADYYSSRPGSLEDVRGERRGLALDTWDENDRANFVEELEKIVEEERVSAMKLGDIEFEGQDEEAGNEEKVEKFWEKVEYDGNGEPIDPNQLANGEW